MPVTGELYPAIEALIRPCDGAELSLYDRLAGNDLDAAVRFGTTGSALGSRPPVSAACLSLVDEIQRYTFEELRYHRVRPRFTVHGDAYVRDTPAELLAINALLVPTYPSEAVVWLTLVRCWTREARRVLGIDTARITVPRDTRCLDCGARDVTEQREGETVIAPAVRLIWGDGYIRAVHCVACNSKRSPIDLHTMAQRFNDAVALPH